MPADIRIYRQQKQFSRPMTGHTPRKLPISRNLPHHRSAPSGKIRRFPLQALAYDTMLCLSCQAQFQKKSQIFLPFFRQYRELRFPFCPHPDALPFAKYPCALFPYIYKKQQNPHRGSAVSCNLSKIIVQILSFRYIGYFIILRKLHFFV